MVKVLKPTPKSLAKSPAMEKVSKKKPSKKKSDVSPVDAFLDKQKTKNGNAKTGKKPQKDVQIGKPPVEIKPMNLKKNKIQKNGNEADLRPLPLPSKDIAKSKKTAISKKAKAGLPPPPTPSPEPKKIKGKATNQKKRGLPPPPTPSPDVKKEKSASQKKVKAGLTAPSTSPEQIKPKESKLKAAKTLLGKSTAKEPETAGKVKTKKPILKKGLTGAEAYKLKKEAKELKKQKSDLSETLKPVEYDEEKFNAILNVENIERTAKALKELVASQAAKKKTSIFSDFKYNLQVASFKIPSCPKRIVRLSLKHSLVNKEDDDVVIVVTDLQRGRKADYEPTIQHYEDLFRENNIEGLKIMPYNQFRQECKTFEAVRKFSNTYDYFLVDGRVAGSVTGRCGKIFQKPRNTFHSVNMTKANIKSEIEKALHRTCYKQLHKGDLISIPVATDKHSPQEVAENVDYVISQLKASFPGGMENVRGMYLKIDLAGTSSLPLYISMAKVPEQSPYVVGPREKRMLKLRKDANDIFSNFRLSKEGELKQLTKSEVERKRKIKEAKAKLLEENTNDPDLEKKPQDIGVAETIVPTKKARRDDNVPSDTKREDTDDVDEDADEQYENEEEQEDDDEDDDEDEDSNAAEDSGEDASEGEEDAADDDDEIDEDEDDDDDNTEDDDEDE